MFSIVKKNFFVLIFLFLGVSVNAQQAQTKEEKDAEYTKVINQRADKIVAVLDITDAGKALRVRDIIAGQYRNLSTIHDSRDAEVKGLKERYKDDKEKLEEERKKVEANADTKLKTLHTSYLAALSKELTADKVEMVKDGMTYRVLPITYTGYMQMLPNLTEEQKKQILAYLTEARELAMDAESSEKKHGWFGKYKGKINNYLSAAGIDMNKASKEWQARIKAEQAAKKGE